MPSFRGELSAFWKKLPPDAQVFVPEVLWEQAVADRSRSGLVRANTLPYNATDERRDRYERYCYADLKPGAILIVNRFQSNDIRRGIDPREWRFERKFSHLLQGSSEWGYDLAIYTYQGRENAAASN